MLVWEQPTPLQLEAAFCVLFISSVKYVITRTIFYTLLRLPKATLTAALLTDCPIMLFVHQFFPPNLVVAAAKHGLVSMSGTQKSLMPSGINPMASRDPACTCLPTRTWSRYADVTANTIFVSTIAQVVLCLKSWWCSSVVLYSAVVASSLILLF